MKLDCLILAAGSASRFGGCKLLANWNGKPLVAQSIEAACTLEPENIFIVGGAYYEQLQQALPDLPISTRTEHTKTIELLEFRAWDLGVGNSLAFGVKRLQNANPVLVMLGDQPLISAKDLQHLHRTWSENPERIVCASFANTLGVPAIFPARFKAELYRCRGDRGAKSILLRYFNKDEPLVIPIAMPSAEFDIDTPTDFKIHREKIQRYLSA
jgi:molybdenum cofactor cytidylyltransferase